MCIYMSHASKQVSWCHYLSLMYNSVVLIVVVLVVYLVYTPSAQRDSPFVFLRCAIIVRKVINK